MITCARTDKSISIKQLYSPCTSTVSFNIPVMNLTHPTSDVRREPFWSNCFEMALSTGHKDLYHIFFHWWIKLSTFFHGQLEEPASKCFETHILNYFCTFIMTCLGLLGRAFARASWYIMPRGLLALSRTPSQRLDTTVTNNASLPSRRWLLLLECRQRTHFLGSSECFFRLMKDFHINIIIKKEWVSLATFRESRLIYCSQSFPRSSTTGGFLECKQM